MSEKMKFAFEVPEGYLIDEVPPSAKLELEKDGLWFDHQVLQEGQ